MNQSKIAVRYAKAFFQLATEKGKLKEYRKDIDTLYSVFTETDMRLIAESPTLKESGKKKIFTDLFKGKISDDALNFILVITNNKREVYISDICRNFIDQHREHNGVRAAVVTTATEMDDDLKEKVSVVISDVFKTEVELSTVTNENIMGGFVLRVGDKQIDASIATKLKNIKREFLQKSI